MPCEAINNTWWKPCTEAFYDSAFGALYPAWHGAIGFLCGEPDRTVVCTVAKAPKPAYRAFVEIEGRYYVSATPLTCDEFHQITPEVVMARISEGEPVECLP